MKKASLSMGKNHAYLQQFIKRGKPAVLPEEIRKKLARLTGLTEDELGKPAIDDYEPDGGHILSDDIANPAGDINLKTSETYEALTKDVRYRAKIPGASPEIDGRSGAGQGQVGMLEHVSISRGEAVTGHKVLNEWLFPSSFLRHEMKATPSGILVLEVIGDSMAPTLLSGDRLLIDTSQNIPYPEGLFVFDEGNGPMVKRLQPIRKSSPATIEIISDNPRHTTYIVLANDIIIIGRVVGRISKI